MAQLSLRSVKKQFGPNTIIKNLDLDVPDGIFLVIVGPSGCGKSTVLRLIAGLEELSGGEIYIGDTLVNRLEPKDRNVAMVFQNYALYPHMTVRDNICYGLKVQGYSKEDQQKRLEGAARMLGLAELLDRLPRQLSGGQRQRVAMGRAIVREPRVFLFDEPLSNLDAALRNQMRVELRRLHQSLGTTSIYVTHDQVEAMTLAERIVVMHAGEVEQYGTPDDLYLRPATAFVAGFIGSPSMNMFDAQFKDGIISLPGGSTLDAAAHSHFKLGQDGLVHLGVRPEDLLPASDCATHSLNCVVELTEVLGADTLAHCRLKDVEHGYSLIARLDGSHRPAIGENLCLQVRDGRAHLFDAQSLRRLAAKD